MKTTWFVLLMLFSINSYSQDYSKVDILEFIKDIHLNTNKTTNVWIITHTLVLKQVCKKYRKTFPHRIPFLYTIPIR